MTETPRPFSRLLLTGAAGALGRSLAPALRAVCDQLVISDLAGPLASLGDPGAVACDLSQPAEVARLLVGVDAVVHLGGVSVEGPFEPILQANIRGLFNLYEAARLAGTRRIVYASSNHVTGCYEQGQRIGPDDPVRPDGFYGVSKLFGEGIAHMYFDRFGIETVCLRIGTAVPKPAERRELSTWLSLADLDRLVIASLTAPGVGCTVAYGMSNNPRGWWDSTDAWARLGYVPRDSSEEFADKVQHITADPATPMARLQGGRFLGVGPFEFPPPHTTTRRPE
ncbi:MAG: NAD(P)-dependent oxidoreductase [Burkholderiaceae bacterium]